MKYCMYCQTGTHDQSECNRTRPQKSLEEVFVLLLGENAKLLERISEIETRLEKISASEKGKA